MQKFLYPIHSTISTKNHKNISILVSLDFFMRNEIHAQKIIKTIINHDNFFCIFDIIEYITYNELNNDDYFLESSTIINPNTDLALLTYRDKSIYTLYEYLSVITNPIHKYRLIIDSYQYLLSSIKILLQHNLVHNNINANTICIYNFDDIKPILLKFNKSIHIVSKNHSVDFIKPYLLDYNASNIYLPIEFHIISFLLTNTLDSLSNINIETIVNNIYKENNMLFLLDEKDYGNIVQDYRNEAINYLNKYINKNIEYIVTDIFNYYQTWDNYNLSIFFLENILPFRNDSFYNSFIKILICNIHPNPNKRLTINITIDKFKNI